MTGPSLAGRAALAVALTIGFYLLALTLGIGLIAAPIALYAIEDTGNVWVAIAMIAAGFTILRAIVPTAQGFEPPGPPLDERSQPELFRELKAVADELGEPLPEETYLDPQVNAGVLEVGRSRKRVMVVGLPLMASLTPLQLRGVIAHEYGHYVAGDTRFSAWIWRTRYAVLNTAGTLAGKDSWFQRVIVRAPFVAYAKLFLRLTNAISRRQEFAADAVAAKVAGAEAQADALRAVTAAAPAFDAFWGEEVAFALNSGRRPPMTSGFQRFLAETHVRAQLDELVTADVNSAETNPYDSHPTLKERLNALGAQQTGDVDLPAPQDSAAALLRDVDGLERALLVHTFGADDINQLRPIDWDHMGEVYAANAAEVTGSYASVFQGTKLGDARRVADAPEQWWERLRRALGEQAADAHDTEIASFGRFVLLQTTIHTLVTGGWQIDAQPGRPIRLTRSGQVFEPAAALMPDKPEVAPWAEQTAALGIADLPLSAGSGLPAPERP